MLRGGIAAPNNNNNISNQCTSLGPRLCPSPKQWTGAASLQSDSAACLRTPQTSRLATNARKWPLALVFPMRRALWIYTGRKPTAMLAATGILKGTFHSLGWLKEGMPHCAPPATLLSYHHHARRICPVRGASLPWCSLGPQRWPRSRMHDTAPQALSLSLRRHSKAARARL